MKNLTDLPNIVDSLAEKLKIIGIIAESHSNNLFL